MKKIIRILLVMLLPSFFVACSPSFVLQAAFEEGKILWNREYIQDVLENPKSTLDEKKKLKAVLEAREFAKQIGLDPGESYTMYSKVDREVLLWVVAGSKPTSFDLATWWFPFVGEVPYKGFFYHEDAEDEARSLKFTGYESYIREADAFSTLGWFNDPVLSTTLKHEESTIVNIVIHETLHRNIWIPDNVGFNESLANFVGIQGAIEFYYQKLEQSNPENTQFSEWQNHLFLAENAKKQNFVLAQIVRQLYEELHALYESNLCKPAKLKRRKEIFDSHIDPIRKINPDLSIFKTPNNAEIIQYYLYLEQIEDFDRLYTLCEKNWARFFAKIKEIQAKTEEDSEEDPFALLGGLVGRDKVEVE